MKKVMSVLLIVALFLVYATIPSYASEKSVTKEKLGVLIEYFKDYEPGFGDYTPYDTTSLWTQVNEASRVYRDEASTDAEYTKELDDLINAYYNMPISPYYAYETVVKAAKLKNVNQYYNKNDWSEFQRCIAVLRSEFGKGTNEELSQISNDEVKVQDITDKFHQLLNAYNRMTQTGFVRGDVDGDGNLTIKDVTLLQSYLVDYTDLTGAQLMRGSVTAKSEFSGISVSDATEIQREIADFSVDFAKTYAVIGEVETYESDEYLYSHLFSYDICSDNFLGMGLPKVFYSTIYYQSLHRFCANRGIVIS